jgi:hypothetical protein
VRVTVALMGQDGEEWYRYCEAWVLGDDGEL